MSTSLTTLSDELATAVAEAGKFVVSVHGHPRVAASGVLWKPGVIITAEHMLRRDEGIRVTLPDGTTTAAELAGRDGGTDLAVLKVAGHDSPPLQTATEVRPGNLAIAVGRSPETGLTAALGIVSGSSGAWQTWRGGRVDQLIRLDLRLYPASSGAAVVDATGKFLGMATGGLSRTSPLAIPVITIDRVTKILLEKGRIARGYLGVGLQPVTLPEHLKTKLSLANANGMIVLSVEPDAPAGRAGLVIGDIMVALDGKPVNDIQAVLGADSVGRTLRASVVRGGELLDVDITVEEKPRRRGSCR